MRARRSVFLWRCEQENNAVSHKFDAGFRVLGEGLGFRGLGSKQASDLKGRS